VAGVVAKGCTFTFGTMSAAVTRINVETPVADVVDMTSITDVSKKIVMVPAGTWRGGRVNVDYLRASNGADLQFSVGAIDTLTLSGSDYSVSRKVVLESATTEAGVGELVRGTIRFLITDHTVTQTSI